MPMMRAGLPVVTILAGLAISGPTWASMPILEMPMQVGAGPGSSLTVKRFAGCLEHGPIPLRIGDVSAFANGRTIIRFDDDLDQEELVFQRAPSSVRLVEVRRAYGATLSHRDELSRYIRLACRQAKMQARQMPTAPGRGPTGHPGLGSGHLGSRSPEQLQRQPAPKPAGH